MSDDTGYAIIRNAIPPDLALEAAEMVSGSLRVKVARDKFTEFEVPDICLRVQQEFIEVSLLTIHSPGVIIMIIEVW